MYNFFIFYFLGEIIKEENLDEEKIIAFTDLLPSQLKCGEFISSRFVLSSPIKVKSSAKNVRV